MKVSKTKLDGVLLIEPHIFEDYRGFYVETYNEELYRKHGIDIHFVTDDISVSSHHVLRGIHGNSDTWKLVSCHYGRFYLVVLNCDPESPNLGQWVPFVLSDRNHHQVLIPPKHGNGHVVLSEVAIFHYKQSTYYDPKSQFTYCWNDPRLNIWWPVKNPILSQRDETGYFVE
ncbi:MAG: dTDP-4-dehydrorhamnose 3,5-epimerase family protein [Candidatus Sungiibacteriota bacterium]|uniref:dTDP-4-dehydrorhamnose 3,5-epimerase family protein n=1 Tax=Candidatus Sungiibacteriota bacterium TaxID=2750080 RepID=A0A7T5RKJ3_9BACT|nr:MAG: dTDP-4-dehydrorhamnose 3,5-epimerase family protein [Candidatus Sungbacteria bacterium]